MAIHRWFLAAGLSALMSGISLGVEVVRVGSGFSEPVFLTYAPTDPQRVYVVEKGGAIKILDPSSGLNTPFLRVDNISTVNESGLLGLAFHPDYATNGKFYVNVINAEGDTEIRQYSVSAHPELADPTSGQVILKIDQPAHPNHKAGWIAFGPDKNLYIATGDGGGSYDPDNNAQNRSSLLGKLLRISVNPSGAPPSYTVPEDNPVVSDSRFAPEVWAYGLRNPYRNSFDRQTGDLFIADVGQNSREEINFQPAGSRGGANYGWNLREGKIATPSVGGTLPEAIDPIYDYERGVAPFQGFVVIGGYVYRGTRAPELYGQYLFGDYYLGRIWSLDFDANGAFEVVDWTDRLQPNEGPLYALTSFGEDANGELFLMTQTGNIFQVVPEPGTLGLIGTGMMALATVLVRRTKERQQ